jgi:hypothetical protein
VKSNFLNHEPLETAETLEKLARDLRSMAQGDVPQQNEITKAPLLCNWSFAQRPRMVLSGKMYGHPNIADGHLAVTSELFVIDPGQQWARTYSRLYALGPSSRFGLPN